MPKQTDKSSSKFTKLDLADIVVGEPLPSAVYIYIDLHYIAFRLKGDVFDREVYERLELRRVNNLYILINDQQKFKDWKDIFLAKKESSSANKGLVKAKKELSRTALDIFSTDHPNEVVKKTLLASKKVAEEIMKAPLATMALTQLQSFSNNIANHSSNVSILSTYLALHMGYSHLPILQNVASGGLLHDIGKLKVKINQDDSQEVSDKKMQSHPLLGSDFLQAQDPNVSLEILLIVSQHHEFFDGTGYPRRLRGNAIYDLAKIVTIANIFDNLVANVSGTLPERQKKALRQLSEAQFYNKFDLEKHQKALRILELGV
ncbi:MAG: HD domain-containing protein [Bdellovibrio sp.]|nr:HD domain-containing protein [Bdellovibrio sp.]